MTTPVDQKSIRQALDGTDPTSGWRSLRRLAQSGSASAVEFERLGALVAKRAERLVSVGIQSERVALLGQCTTSWLGNALCFAAVADDTVVRILDAEYDSVVPELTSEKMAEFQPQTIMLVPWHKALVRSGSAEALVAEELAFWEQAWRLVSGLGARLVQVGYDWIHPGPLGFHLDGGAQGHVGRIRRLNDALRDRLPKGAYFVDLPLVSGELGRRAMYDPRGYYWTKNPFTPEGTAWLAQHLWAGTRALRTGPRKVAALDLDNTLWGGVVGEVGPLDVALGESADGEAFRAFQTYLSGLADRGVVLAVTSKNNPDDAKEPFAKNPNMVLRMEQIAAFEANWEAKSHSLARIADALRLGLDAFVFVDDSPVEREQVRAALPEVTVLEVSDEPADLAFRLSSSLLFESASVTEADRERAEQYRVEQLRDAVQRSFDTLDDYLRSLELRGRARPVADHDMLRVAQLVAKTNQFNLTTRRHDRETLERMCKTPDAICLSLHLADRFGDYGLIGLLLAVPRSARALEIDTWLMSCRALGRTAEHYLFRELLGLARATGVERLSGSFLPTKKNAQVASLLPSLGFSEVRRDDDGSRHFELSMRDAEAPKTFVTKWD